MKRFLLTCLIFILLIILKVGITPIKAAPTCTADDVYVQSLGAPPEFSVTGLQPFQSVNYYITSTQPPGVYSSRINTLSRRGADRNGNLTTRIIFTPSPPIYNGGYELFLVEANNTSRIVASCSLQVLAGKPPPPPSPSSTLADSPDIKGLCNEGEITTAVGCIPVANTNEFVKWVLGWALGIAGGVAFLLILGSGFIIMTASGKPEQLQHGRELLTAAISGLILIIFSVFLLQLIGVQILNIPGL